MIHEWRTYRLKVGAANAYLSLLAEEGLPIVTRHLPLMGYWLAETGMLNTIHHLWSYADWSEREASRAALGREEGWTAGFVPKAFAMVEQQENRLLALTDSSPEFEAALANRKQVRAAWEAGAPLYADKCAVLLNGASATTDGLACWTPISGRPDARMTLMPRCGDPLSVCTNNGTRHLVLRPLILSPL